MMLFKKKLSCLPIIKIYHKNLKVYKNKDKIEKNQIKLFCYHIMFNLVFWKKSYIKVKSNVLVVILDLLALSAITLTCVTILRAHGIIFFYDYDHLYVYLYYLYVFKVFP